MAQFKCDGCGAVRELTKTTTVYRDDKWVTKEAECTCEKNKYMNQVMTSEYEGIPNLKRTEDSLTKNKK
tara:strand:- start:33 stop:239 length:207 start_codon:yes stop_codon:yes gene_type:complete